MSAMLKELINSIKLKVGLLVIVLLLMAAPLVIFLASLAFLPLLGALVSYCATLSILPAGIVLMFGPLFLLPLWYQASAWIRREVEIIEMLGPERALWVRKASRPLLGSAGSGVAEMAVWSGWDISGPYLSSPQVSKWLQLLGITEEQAKEGWAGVGSRIWSAFVLSLDRDWSMPLLRVATVAYTVAMLARASRVMGKLLIWYWVRVFVIGWVLFEMPADSARTLLRGLLRAIGYMQGHRRHRILEWAKWRVTMLVTEMLLVTSDIDHAVKRKVSRSLSGDTVTFIAHFREFVIQAVSVLADMKLPEYIRSSGWSPPTVEALARSNELMASLGWPVNVNLTSSPDPVGFKFKEWLLCGSDFSTGIKNMKVRTDEALRALFPERVDYVRTETYATVENELQSTSRYFIQPDYKMPDLDVDEVWELLRPIFKDSRLTPFNYIIRMWEKKYALGSFMVDPATGKKYNRAKFIRAIGGYAPFKALWANTFYWATQFVPTAAVSVKGEALPPRKWMENKVRTVIGSPITQYILSTVWNYGPNHRFAWESTPIKIGMPLNGGTMGQIWANHSRCQLHIEGDFSEFDSTLSGNIKDLVKKIRQKGYENHKDHRAIADLIDVNYEQVNDQLLNTTSTGNVYRKGLGFTTGHSSTSMDNSVALVVLYLMAWKEITGLSAREFKFYNELSCFGDDHFLSILGFHPSGWTPSNIRKTMGRWGVTNNLTVKPLSEIEFLAKFCKRPNAAMRSELNEAGLHGITMAVWHNKEKLIGKLTAQVKSLNPQYKVERLVSFVGLTAHHKDVYDGIVRYFEENSVMKRVLANSKHKLPSYNKVLRDWYDKTSEQLRTPHFEEDRDEMEHTGKIYQYGEVGAIDSLLGSLSLVPDLLNPSIFNYGYHKIVQARLRPYLAWVYDFVVVQNNLVETGAVRFALSRTPYRFLEPELFVLGDSGSNRSEMLARHWVYCALIGALPTFRPPAYVDFVVRKIASLQYLINGKLQSEMATASPYLPQVLLAAAVSFISLPDWFGFLGGIKLPDINAIVQMASHLFMVTIWQNVPALYQEVERALKYHNWEKGPVLVEAATGTGKSTDLPLFLANRFGHRYSKVVLIVPRTALAVSLVAYLNTISSIGVSGSCEGLALDRNAKVWVVTSGALWQLLGTMPADVLFIFDEAHLIEDRHVLTKELLKRRHSPMIMTTATPSVTNATECGLHMQLNAANLFGRTDLVWAPTDQKVSLMDLNKRLVGDLLGVAAKARPASRCLFFVNTKEQAESFARRAPRPTAVLVSGVPIDTSFKAQWYVSTTVADVGLTIPDLDVVATPNVTPWGKDKIVKLSTSLYRQRAGRTGRTNNGVVYTLSYNVDVPDAPTAVALDQNLFGALFPSGLPPSLVARDWPQETLAALGVPRDISDPVVKARLVASADFLLNTLQPVSMHLREASYGANTLVGAPYAPVSGTVSAAFSRTAPQNQEEWERVVTESLQFVMSEALAGSNQFVATGVRPPLSNYALPEHMSNSFSFQVTGLQKACMDVLNVWHDPAKALASLSERIPSQILSELSAAFEVAAILKE